MIRSVIWSPEAIKTYNSNLEYLESQWGYDVHDQFIERVYQMIAKISQNPKLFICIDTKTNLFRSVITKQVSLFYRIQENEVYLINFWNNHQAPERMPQ